MKTKLFALVLALALALSACGASQGSTGGASGSGEPSAPESGGASVPEEGAPHKDVDLSEFYASLLEEQEWPELMALEGETLDGFYPGLSDLSPKQCLVNVAAISAAVGEIALVELETEEDAQKAAEIFQARIDYQVGDDNNPGGAWYPETIEGWKTNSQIVSNGNYVMLAVGSHAAEAAESFQQLFA